DLVLVDLHGHVQVAGRRAAEPGLALAREADALAVLHPGGDADVDRALAVADPRAAARGARVVDDGPGAATRAARFGERECALCAVDHAGAVAPAAHLRAGAGLRTAPVAGHTR